VKIVSLLVIAALAVAAVLPVVAEAAPDDAVSRGAYLVRAGGWRRGAAVPLKASADEALEGTSSIEHVVVVRRTGNDVPMTDGRDHRPNVTNADLGEVAAAYFVDDLVRRGNERMLLWRPWIRR